MRFSPGRIFLSSAAGKSRRKKLGLLRSRFTPVRFSERRLNGNSTQVSCNSSFTLYRESCDTNQNWTTLNSVLNVLISYNSIPVTMFRRGCWISVKWRVCTLMWKTIIPDGNHCVFTLENVLAFQEAYVLSSVLYELVKGWNFPMREICGIENFS